MQGWHGTSDVTEPSAGRRLGSWGRSWLLRDIGQGPEMERGEQPDSTHSWAGKRPLDHRGRGSWRDGPGREGPGNWQSKGGRPDREERDQEGKGRNSTQMLLEGGPAQLCQLPLGGPVEQDWTYPWVWPHRGPSRDQLRWGGDWEGEKVNGSRPFSKHVTWRR